jgi:NAD(P)-dependent dehydrogenase (short-subunit alcohol dehydrogenase family)
MRLQDKVAIVTGAASGMGAATARLFAAEGAKVVLADITEDAGAALAAEIGGDARFQKLDVTSEADWEALVAATLSAFGRIDVLINNAGVSGSHPDVLNTATWDEQMNVNARGVFLGMRAVIPQMQAAPSSTSRRSPASSASASSTWATTPPRARCASRPRPPPCSSRATTYG